jgi:YD repeat-containing protein
MLPIVQPAVVDANLRFTGSAPVTAGTTTVTIVATDASDNERTAVYEVDQAGTGSTLAYDANGNLTSNGTYTFEWDARNQPLAVVSGSRRTEYVYDGLQRRVRIIEKDNGIVQSDTRLVWCESEICEDRASDGQIVIRRSFTYGEQVNGSARFFASDHLGLAQQ